MEKDKLGNIIYDLILTRRALNRIENGEMPIDDQMRLLHRKEKNIHMLNNFEFELPEKKEKEKDLGYEFYANLEWHYYSDGANSYPKFAVHQTYGMARGRRRGEEKTYKVTFNPHPVFELVEE